MPLVGVFQYIDEFAAGEFAEVCRLALQHGVWLRPLGNVIVIMPPLSIALSELDQILEAIRLGITAMAETTADQVATTSNQSNP